MVIFHSYVSLPEGIYIYICEGMFSGLKFGIHMIYIFWAAGSPALFVARAWRPAKRPGTWPDLKTR